MNEKVMYYSNPWKGLDSYTEEDSHLFCGRDQEISELTDLIEQYRIVTLYGRSGTGKTSLIKAGVFARLKQLGDYSPVVIRLLKDCNISEESYEECIKRSISSLSEKTKPVVVLDQFEEILREYPRQSVQLLKWIRGYNGDIPNARIVFSIREDDLYRLEDLLDRNNIDQMKETRYRLRDISIEGAGLVLMAVAYKNGIRVESGLFEKLVGKLTSIEKKNKVPEKGKKRRSNSDEIPMSWLFGRGRKSVKIENDNDEPLDSGIREPILEDKDQSTVVDTEVSTLILSLCCNRMYRNMVEKGRKEEGIISKDLESLGDDPLFTYYQEATEGMSLRKLKYLEKMAPSGYRIPKSRKELLDILGEKDFKKISSMESDQRILTLSSKGNGKLNNGDSDDDSKEEYELLHDRLARSIYEESRSLQRKRVDKAKKWGLIVYAIVSFTLGPLLVFHLLKPPTEHVIEHGKKTNDIRSRYSVPNGHLELLKGDTVHINSIDASAVRKLSFRGGVLTGFTNNITLINVDTVVIGKEGTCVFGPSVFLPNARFAIVESQENNNKDITQYIIAPKLERINCDVDSSSDVLRWSCGTLYKKNNGIISSWKVLVITKNSALTITDTTAISCYNVIFDPLDFPDGESAVGNSIIEYDLSNPPEKTVSWRYYRLVYKGKGAVKISRDTIDSIREWLYEVNLRCDVSIDTGTFSNCPRLSKVYAPKITKVPDNAFRGCPVLNEVSLDSTTEIGDYAFLGDSMLREINIPKVRVIRRESFESCVRLNRVIIPDVDSIGTSSFNSSGLRCAVFPNLVFVGYGAFTLCQQLECVDFPKYKGSDSSDQERIFLNCKSLSSVSLPSLTIVGRGMFEGCISIKEMTLHNVKKLGSSSFMSCNRLRHVDLPQLKEIERNCFEDCILLDSINFPNVEFIPNNVFKNCYSLQYVSFPKVTKIDSSAFLNCISLKDDDSNEFEDVGYYFANKALVIYGDTIDCLRILDTVDTVIVRSKNPVIKRIKMTRKKIKNTCEIGYGSWLVAGYPLWIDNDTINITFNRFTRGVDNIFTLYSTIKNKERIFREISVPPNTKVAITTSWYLDYNRLPQDCVLLVPYGCRNQYLTYWPNVEEMSRWETWKRQPVILFDFVFTIPVLLQLAVAIIFIVLIWFVCTPSNNRLRYLWMYAVLAGVFSLAVIGSWNGLGPLAYIGYPMHINMAELSLVFCLLWTVWLTIIWGKKNKRKIRSFFASLKDNTFVYWMVKIWRMI